MLATVITDASWCPRTKAAGWAAWVRTAQGKVTQSAGFRNRPERSDIAERWALMNGIHIAAAQPGVTSILAQSDCSGILGKIPTSYNGVPVRTRHVKGHTSTADARSWVNRWCDREAKKHMKRGRKDG